MGDKKEEIFVEEPDQPKKPDKKQSLDGSLLDRILAKEPDEIIPWEECVLPSKGYFYDGRIPGGKVEVRPYNLEVEKIWNNQRIRASGQAFDKIMEYCTKYPDPNFTVDQLLSGDYDYLLFVLKN